MSKVDKWHKWIDVICRDCGNALLSRDMFLDLQKMIEKNPKMQVPDYFHDYIRITYIAHVLMMIRKHLKIDSTSVSLVALVRDMLDNPRQVGAPQYASDLQANLDSFTAHAARVEGFADRVIAHRDRRQPAHTPTYTEVNEAIDAMDRLCVQCSTMFGTSIGTCKPAVQYGWLRIFREMGIET